MPDRGGRHHNITVAIETDLQHRWTELDTARSPMLSLCEEYAQWTLPYLFPSNNMNESSEFQVDKDSIGALAVNHLANKCTTALFPGQRLFFRLLVDAETQELIGKAMQTQGTVNVDDAKKTLDATIAGINQQMLLAEKKCQEHMNMVGYRPQAVEAAKMLIVTGNALEYNPKGKPTIIYNLRNYVVVRDIAGEVIEIITREQKAFETFTDSVREKLRDSKPTKGKNIYDDQTNVAILTQIKLEDDGKWHVKQMADNVKLDTSGATWTKKKLPWIPLVWNLAQGENYGRGLVAEYAGAFHAVNTLSGSLLNIAAITGDIKFLVNPSSVLDVVEMNKSAPGTYHSGKEGDISTPKVDKVSDAQFIQAMIERYQRQIAQAFLLNSELTRDAERVTAEEIRRDARELEMSVGGIYSRLAAQWQQPKAYILLDQIGFDGVGDGIEPQIITGMDSLSRLSEMDNIHLWLYDLTLLNNVPEDVRAWINVPGYMAVTGNNRQVDYGALTKTAAQMAAEQQAAQKAQQEMVANEQAGEAQVAASKEAMKE